MDDRPKDIAAGIIATCLVILGMLLHLLISGIGIVISVVLGLVFFVWLFG